MASHRVDAEQPEAGVSTSQGASGAPDFNTSIGEVRPPAYSIDDLERDAKEGVQEVQRRVLTAILALNENTEYLRSYGLDRSSSVERFKAAHPLTTYGHFKPWVEREASNFHTGSEPKILCGEKIAHFLLTSGSTDSRKLIPETEGSLTRATRLIVLAASIFTRFFGAESNAYALRLVNMTRPQPLPGGLQAMHLVPALTRFGLDKFPDAVSRTMSSPAEVFTLFDAEQAAYCHMLCALAGAKKLTQMRTSFAASFVAAFHTLERDWRGLVEDVRSGGVNAARVGSEEVRAAIATRMARDCEDLKSLADELEAEFQKGFDGIIPRVWPKVKFVECILTGPMAPYLEPLRRFAGPYLPLVTLTYGSSEAFVGINVDLSSPDPSTARYTVLPREAFWEFIPVEATGSESPTTLGLHELEVGRCYEVVLTNYGGLYRYRLEDIVKVEAHLHSLPQISFQYRRGVLAIQGASEHVTERDLAAAVADAAAALAPRALRLVEYTTAIDMECRPPRYTVFWEVEPLPGNAAGRVELPAENQEEASASLDVAELADALDRAVQAQNASYDMSRSVKKELSKLELCVVRAGTFDELFRYKVAQGAHAGQYKVPRCLKTEDVLGIFRRNVQRSSAPDSQWVTGGQGGS